ncbi:MAG TPA: hypothetical protein VIK60_08345 [Vicinamibacterales bacterium]
MRRLTVIATAVAVLLAMLTLNIAAQQPDTRDRTIMTFSAAVELPSLRLEPGTYVFRLADTASRNVIQVLSQDEMQMLGQWLFVPAERQEITGDTVVTFRETSAGATPAVQFWFYPGERIGKEFIYPKDQALRIARSSGAAVLSEDGRVTEEDLAAPIGTSGAGQGPDATEAEGNIGIVDGDGLPKAEVNTRANAQRAGQDRAVGTAGRSDVQQESTVARNAQSAQDELPSTASPIALGSLIGLLSLVGVVGIRMFRM